jgi:hypothetical protein
MTKFTAANSRRESIMVDFMITNLIFPIGNKYLIPTG